MKHELNSNQWKRLFFFLKYYFAIGYINLLNVKITVMALEYTTWLNWSTFPRVYFFYVFIWGLHTGTKWLDLEARGSSSYLLLFYGVPVYLHTPVHTHPVCICWFTVDVKPQWAWNYSILPRSSFSFSTNWTRSVFSFMVKDSGECFLQNNLVTMLKATVGGPDFSPSMSLASYCLWIPAYSVIFLSLLPVLYISSFIIWCWDNSFTTTSSLTSTTI